MVFQFCWRITTRIGHAARRTMIGTWEVYGMKTKALIDGDGLVSLGWVASRWSVARATAMRILERNGARPLFLSGEVRGVRRYYREDVERIEAASRADRPQPQ